ncbi:MAG: 16S rRNA methyltransferase [Bifidobacteriaceae bacterium]|nr:16S rRNA methyltransferase [Bifidobacteriaceae bacterium]
MPEVNDTELPAVPEVSEITDHVESSDSGSPSAPASDYSEPEDTGPRQRSVTAPSERTSESDAPRRAAYDLLQQVEDGAYANLALPSLLAARHLSGLDAAFATELAYGTIRMRGRYDPVIEKVAERPLRKLYGGLVSVLRLGIHQLTAMRVPDHAAVDSSVALAREALGTGPSHLVNAVLRVVADAGFEALEAEILADRSEDDALGIRTSHPAWTLRALRRALVAGGRHDGDLLAVLEANNVPAPTTLVARPGLITPEDLLAEAGDGARVGRFAPTAVIMAHGAPGALAPVRDGLAGVQDEGSQAVALALTDAPLEGSDERWLDLCAGPGGKAALLGALAAGRGARVHAVELHGHRADLVRAIVQPETVTVEVGDGREIGETHPGEFDRVLVDVPCTGLGALRRRPEARWRHSPSDLASLGPLQRELLTSGIRAARPGGVIAYVTCSPHLAETTLVVEDVLRREPGCHILDASAAAPALAEAGVVRGDGTAQLWTDRDGTDAMFLALIVRGD